MNAVILTLTLLLDNGAAQTIVGEQLYQSLQHCAYTAEAAAPEIFRQMPEVVAYEYICEEVTRL